MYERIPNLPHVAGWKLHVVVNRANRDRLWWLWAQDINPLEVRRELSLHDVKGTDFADRRLAISANHEQFQGDSPGTGKLCS